MPKLRSASKTAPHEYLQFTSVADQESWFAEFNQKSAEMAQKRGIRIIDFNVRCL